ncbi:hypothetical protein Pmar_PMAR027349, partial [Perkinsus marinus ATCC 50983]
MSFWGLKFDHSHCKANDTSYFRCPETLASRMVDGIRTLGKAGELQRPTVLIIDEVVTVFDSMLLATDQALRELRQEHGLFGNVHMIFIGDPLQLQGATPERYGAYSDIEVAPIWECELWNVMPLKTYFLRSFNRGSSSSALCRPGRRGRRPLPYTSPGPDIPYMEFLAEIRGANTGSPLSESASGVAAAIRDVEGEHEPEWTAVTIYRATADRINERHLRELPGDVVTFKAGVTDNRVGEDHDIGILAVPLVINLKPGCRIMFTTNCRGKFCNGDLGIISEFMNIESETNSVQYTDEYADSETSMACIRVRLDRTGQDIVVFPITQIVAKDDGSLLYRR